MTTGFDAVVGAARLALQSSGESIETLHSHVDRAASAYRIGVDVMVLPEQMRLKQRGSETPEVWPSYARSRGARKPQDLVRKGS